MIKCISMLVNYKYCLQQKKIEGSGPGIQRQSHKLPLSTSKLSVHKNIILYLFIINKGRP